MEQIAVIRLSKGQVGYYDELSRIHLTLNKPEAIIYAGTNCTQLRRSIKSGRLKLISGSLGKEDIPKKLKKVSTFTKGSIIKKSESKSELVTAKKSVEPAKAEIKTESKVIETTNIESKKNTKTTTRTKKIDNKDSIKKIEEKK